MPKVILSKSSEKDFAKLPKNEQGKAFKKLKVLGINPLSGKPLTGELNKLYSIRAWPYRIIYELDKKKNIVIIYKIQHRQGVYKN